MEEKRKKDKRKRGKKRVEKKEDKKNKKNKKSQSDLTEKMEPRNIVKFQCKLWIPSVALLNPACLVDFTVKSLILRMSKFS